MSVPDWPTITDPALLARLREPDETLYDHLPAFLARMPATVVDPDLRRRIDAGRSYPFARADQPVIVRGGEVVPGRALGDDRPRFALLAIGSNASPERLIGKFTGVDDGAVRLTPAVLHDHDVCALPYPVSYGAFPAGLAHSPGTRVDVAILEVTQEQLEWLAFTEFGYHLGALRSTVRMVDGRVLNRAHVFVQRRGLFAAEGRPVALEAVLAHGRRLRAMSQREVLAEWVRRRFGDADDPDRRLMEALTHLDHYGSVLLPQSVADAVSPALPTFQRHPATVI